MTHSLKALAEAKTEGINKATYFKVDPRIIEVEEGFNGRIEGKDLDDYIAELKAAILGGANLPPLDVRVEDGRVILVDGHCRTRAYKELIEEGHEFKAVECRPFTGNAADRVAHMIGSSQGRPLSPLERAHAYLRLAKMGWEPGQIAERVGKTQTHVQQTMKLTELEGKAQHMIAKGKIAAHLALELVNKIGPAKASERIIELVAKAEASGKKKATAKTAATVPSFPKEVTHKMIQAVDALREHTNTDELSFVNDPSELEGIIVVPRAALAALIAAHDEIEDIRTKRIDREKKANAPKKKRSKKEDQAA